LHQIRGSDREAPAEWVDELTQEDLAFIKRFILASGSLKAVAAEYGVSYPTVRSRLDRLITKVDAIDKADVSDPFERRLRALVADMVVSPTVARDLLNAHNQQQIATGRSKE
jgi:hypothetical protein